MSPDHRFGSPRCGKQVEKYLTETDWDAWVALPDDFPVFRTILSLKKYNIVNQVNNNQKRVVLGHLAPFFV